MSSKNPYAPPAHSESQGGSSPALGANATRGERLVTFIIDLIVIRVLSTALLVPFVTTLGRQAVVLGAWGIVLGPVYYIVLEATTGRTVGKLLVGTRVVTDHPGPPSVSQIVRRTLCRCVPVDPVSFLFSESGWHDRWSGTRVAKVHATGDLRKTALGQGEHVPMNPKGSMGILFSFRGRIPRTTYAVCCALPLTMVGIFLLVNHPGPKTQGVVLLATGWPSLAMHVKRWHDQNRSGWWQLLGLVPGIGLFAVVMMCGFVRGTVGVNRYGEDTHD